jgi:hypothetical protein
MGDNKHINRNAPRIIRTKQRQGQGQIMLIDSTSVKVAGWKKRYSVVNPDVDPRRIFF